MIIELQGTTTSQIAKRLVEVREEGGAVALGRVLTLVVITEAADNEAAIRAANAASSEHPMRVIVLHTDDGTGPSTLNAEIRVGRDAGAGDVVVLHASGDSARDPETLVQGLLLPDAPVVAWWPDHGMMAPSRSPIGRIAQVRIIDTQHAADGAEALTEIAEHFAPGDTNLTWTRLTRWRAQLAAVLDQPPYEQIERAEVVARRGSAGAILMAGWLQARLQAPVELVWQEADEQAHNLRAVRLHRASGPIELERLSPTTARLRQPGQPEQLIPLTVRDTTEALAEELRSLAPDEMYAEALLEGVPVLCANGVCRFDFEAETAGGGR